MVYQAYDGLITGGWLTFWLVIFSILAIVAILWVFLYFRMSQNKSKKISALVIVIASLIVTFEIHLIFIKTNLILY